MLVNESDNPIDFIVIERFDRESALAPVKTEPDFLVHVVSQSHGVPESRLQEGREDHPRPIYVEEADDPFFLHGL